MIARKVLKLIISLKNTVFPSTLLKCITNIASFYQYIPLRNKYEKLGKNWYLNKKLIDFDQHLWNKYNELTIEKIMPTAKNSQHLHQILCHSI